MNYQYLGVSQIINSGRYSLTDSQLRYYLMKRHKNGLSKAVKKIGKHFYIRTDLLDSWIQKKSNENKVK